MVWIINLRGMGSELAVLVEGPGSLGLHSRRGHSTVSGGQDLNIIGYGLRSAKSRFERPDFHVWMQSAHYLTKHFVKKNSNKF